PNLGWMKLKTSEKKQLKNILQGKKRKKKSLTNPNLYFSPPFNLSWHFHQHQLPLQIINLYCKIPQKYSFEELPLDKTKDQKQFHISNSEIGLLKQLYYNRVIHLEFKPWSLIYEHSLDFYSLNLPKFNEFQLKSFLDILPYSEVHETENNIKIWAYICPDIVDWINYELNWEIYSIIHPHFPKDLDINWFDGSKLQWKTPEILVRY
ncbi:MAG: hypothetical protein ACFE9L_06240, partial [Candidatus Hodarchaeota archaeon]